MELNEKIESIAAEYGFDIQAVKLAEECAEYAAISLKILYYRLLLDQSDMLGLDPDIISKKLDEAREKGTEELTDVLILARQVENFITKQPEARKMIDKLMNEKVDRQLKRIKEGQK